MKDIPFGFLFCLVGVMLSLVFGVGLIVLHLLDERRVTADEAKSGIFLVVVGVTGLVLAYHVAFN